MKNINILLNKIIKPVIETDYQTRKATQEFVSRSLPKI